LFIENYRKGDEHFLICLKTDQQNWAASLAIQTPHGLRKPLKNAESKPVGAD
jgi:hypothetical protein